MFISVTKKLARRYHLEYQEEPVNSKNSHAYLWCTALKAHEDKEYLFLMNAETRFLIVMEAPKNNLTENIKRAFIENFEYLGAEMSSIEEYMKSSGPFEYGLFRNKSLRGRLNSDIKKAFERIDFYNERKIDFNLFDIGPEVSILPVRTKEKAKSTIPRAQMANLLDDYNLEDGALKKKIPEILELKCVLVGSEVNTERTILVRADDTFSYLAEVLLNLFDFSHYHLYQFEVFDTNRKFDPDFIIQDEEGIDDFFAMYGPPTLKNGMNAEIGRFIKEADHVNFIYDFGDDWNIKLILRRTYPGSIGDEYYLPYLLSLKGPSPIEDMGGIWRYNWLIDIKKHPELYKDDSDVEAFLDWVGDSYFNPDEELLLPRRVF